MGWLGGIVEAKGVFVVTETPAAQPLVEGGWVTPEGGGGPDYKQL